ncbi:hypothetical protein NBM05_01230 [Rothia sp. AR01]|uniref:Uncharacterized protein n=1 Tax=Rothia santali TaxID=2949643 RepID=A0A9X2KHB2_9MICC|nr:hypothetical protein [Rothia santali]MCP3424690.1 hypothetical protein [Rothia santali]
MSVIDLLVPASRKGRSAGRASTVLYAEQSAYGRVQALPWEGLSPCADPVQTGRGR